jgi:hypothetical protein
LQFRFINSSLFDIDILCPEQGKYLMNTQTAFIFKVFTLSTGVSILIKYGGMRLPIAATEIAASIAIFLPPLIVGLALGWRFKSYLKKSSRS